MERKHLIGSVAAVLVGVALVQILAFGAGLTPSYRIKVQLNTEKHMLFGEENITFTNDTSKALDKLYLHLYPNRFMDESIYAREKGMDAYDSIFPAGPDRGYTFIEGLKLNGATHDYTIDDTIMRIDLKKPLLPGASLELYIKFHVKIPNAILRFGYDKGNYYISWWYPRLAAYDEHGWHPYQAHGNSPDEPYDNFAKYRVEITLPSGMVAGATGVQEGVTQNSDDTMTLTYTAENIHDFAWVTDRRYKVQTASWNGVTIHSLYFPEDTAAGKHACQYAKDALAYFSTRYGNYPYKNFTVAETRMLGGAMEYPQLIMVSYQFYRLPEFLTIFDEVIAHETLHQWFYGMLMNDQTNEAWLDEGFATLSEVSYIEHKYGKKGNMLDLNVLKKVPVVGPLMAGQKSAAHIPTSRGMVVNSYLEKARLGTEAPVLTPRNEIKPGQQPLLYQRGALTLFALKYLVGEETLDKIIKTYVERYRFKHVTTADFIKIAEEVSSQNLKWFFDEWLRTTKRLDYVLEGVSTHKIEGKFVTRVAIRNNGELRMPVDIQATLANGKKVTKRFDPLGCRGTLEFITEQPVESVLIDPGKLLPDVDPANNRLHYSLDTSPLIKPGTQKGDGLIVGIKFSSPDARISGDLGYATKSQKPVYSLNFISSPWIEAGRLAEKGRGLSLGLNLSDDGHIHFAEVSGVYHFSIWSSDLTKWFDSLEARPFYRYLYNLSGDEGAVSGITLHDKLEVQGKAGKEVTLNLGYKGSFAALGSDFPFSKYSLDLRPRQRVSWQTHLSARLFVGVLQGKSPNEAERFDIRKDAGFHTFHRNDNQAIALNLSLTFPILLLNKIDIGPIPISLGFIAFGDLGWFGDTRETVRAEAGWGLTCAPYGSDISLRLEQVLWVNTRKDKGIPGFTIGVDLGL